MAIARRPSLIYPAGVSPGIDWSHPATGQNLRLSVVATPNSFVNLLSGKLATKNGTPSFGIKPFIGPAQTSLANTDFFDFSNAVSVLDNFATCAAIWTPTTLSGNTAFVWFSATSGGIYRFGSGVSDPGEMNAAIIPATAINSGNDLIAGVPYFCAWSINGATIINYLSMRLDTGFIRTTTTASAAGAAAPGPSPIMRIGGDDANRGGRQSIAAVMYSAQYMSMPALIAWAKSGPWNFWYPQGTGVSRMILDSAPVTTLLAQIMM